MNLQDLTYINTTSGRPSPYMTDEKWQNLFAVIKATTMPSKQKSISVCNSHTAIDSYTNIYHGDTLHQTRVRLLNDNLRQIRKGEIDYVYFIYNIAELLKYEHDRLRSRYNQHEQYFEIWLDKGVVYEIPA